MSTKKKPKTNGPKRQARIDAQKKLGYRTPKSAKS